MMSKGEMTNIKSGTAGWHNANPGQKLGIFVRIAATLVLGIVIILWSWAPTYKTLFSSLPDQQAISVLNALYSNGFDAKLDESSGAILIPANDIHIARIKLSNLGIPGMRNSYLSSQERGYLSEFGLDDKNSARNQIGHTQRVEELLSRRIERFLEPLVGSGSVIAQVTINANANNRKIINTTDRTNKAGQKNNKIVKDNDSSAEDTSIVPTLIGNNNNLSITVIVNDKKVIEEGGSVRSISRTPDELEKITGLIRQVTGFNSKRGDTINVINSKFTEPQLMKPVSKIHILDEYWNKEWLRKGVAVLIIVFLVSIVFWSIFKSLYGLSHEDKEKSGDLSKNNQDTLSPSKIALNKYDDNMRKVNFLAENDPKLVAQVIKNWVNADGR